MSFNNYAAALTRKGGRPKLPKEAPRRTASSSGSSSAGAHYPPMGLDRISDEPEEQAVRFCEGTLEDFKEKLIMANKRAL